MDLITEQPDFMALMHLDQRIWTLSIHRQDEKAEAEVMSINLLM